MEAITLRNPSRVLVPFISLGLLAVMYVPVIVMTATDHGDTHLRFVLGSAAFLFCLAWLGYSGLRAPHTATIDTSGISVRRVLGSWRYECSDVAAWSFARDGAKPDQSLPEANALLMLRLRDGTKFRAEVTQQEASTLRSLLPSSPVLSRL